MNTEICVGSVVVTGGSRGVGRAIAEGFLSSYSRVVVLDLEPAPDLHAHPRLAVVQGSASQTEGVEAALEAARTVAPLVGWVNNAALFNDPDLIADGADDFLVAVERNLRPVVRGTEAAVAEFLRTARPGAVVNISSHQALRPVRGAAAYATAKSAIEGFTRAMAVDHGPAGIRVNAVSPGSIETERHEAYLASLAPEAAQQAARLVGQVHALGRIGMPAEVATAVAFLISEAAAFITGAVLPVDGGRGVLASDPEAS